MKTQQAGGGRAAIRGIVSEPGRSKPLIVTGRAVYDGTGMSRGTLTMPDPKSNAPVKLEYVQDGAKMYMRSSQFGTLPEGREWMGLDLAFGEELNTSLPANGDVKGELEMLEKATGGVEKVGREDVRGVPTTRYRGEISAAQGAKRLREEGADKTASYAKKLASPLRVEAWIDAKGLVRRMEIVQLKPGEDGAGSTIHIRTDFFDFGLEPKIDVPDSSEVFDATSLVQEQLNASSDE
ncbi:MAG: hypothetical protein ACTHO8_02420 [Solirubrobacterales bacterium]